jgi:hypothetical protein
MSRRTAPRREHPLGEQRSKLLASVGVHIMSAAGPLQGASTPSGSSAASFLQAWGYTS